MASNTDLRNGQYYCRRPGLPHMRAVEEKKADQPSTLKKYGRTALKGAVRSHALPKIPEDAFGHSL